MGEAHFTELRLRMGEEHFAELRMGEAHFTELRMGEAHFAELRMGEAHRVCPNMICFQVRVWRLPPPTPPTNIEPLIL